MTRTPKALVIGNNSTPVIVNGSSNAQPSNISVAEVVLSNVKEDWKNVKEAISGKNRPSKIVIKNPAPTQSVVNTPKSTGSVKNGPRPAFNVTGFNIKDIDPKLTTMIEAYGQFTLPEQARVNYIINTDFKDVFSKKVDHTAAENQVTHSKKSHEVLLKCLQNNVINETNEILAHILAVINNDTSYDMNMWERFLFKRVKVEELTTSEIISILDHEADNLRAKLPGINDMITSLDDALFHTTQEYKSMRLYYVSGECKIKLIGEYQQNQIATSDPLKLMQQVDERHNYNLFVRKVGSYRTLVEYITASLLQAQGLQNILESMVANIELMLDVNIPAIKQQLLFTNSFKSVKNSPSFVAQRNTLVDNIKSVLDAKK